MARTKNSVILYGLRGKIGDIVIKQYRYGTVVTKCPDMSNIKASRLQKKKRQHFKEAVAYAKKIIANPVKNAAYNARLRRGKTVFHAAISEFLKKKA
jgi:hypothetical protein